MDATIKANRDILPRTKLRLDKGWDDTRMATTLIAWYVPCSGPAKWVTVDVVHHNTNRGITVPDRTPFLSDRARTVTITSGGKDYIAVVPFDRSICATSEAIEDKLGFKWKGEILLFRKAMYSDLCVNMRTHPADRVRVWGVVRSLVLDWNEEDNVVDANAETDGDSDGERFW